ncbi:MAG: peptidase [Oceanospirillaceae bacterium]|nr:peptidase [Oceanospirillaceae bacterium]
MSTSRSILKALLWLFLAGTFSSIALVLGVYLYFAPQLPNADELRNVELQTPLRIYTSDHRLITEIGEKRRTPLTFEQIPPRFIDALLASEDDSFFDHYGIDVKGLLRATLELILSGEKKSGGSTITMQVAKNYHLSNEKTFTRKIKQILLAIRLEQEFTKQEIIELYVNKVFLGKRAYGFEAAAQVYYGKHLNELSIAQTAMVAGLPQAPSANNPISSPRKAKNRRNYVLKRMAELGKITQQEYALAKSEPITARYHGPTSDISAPYVAEIARKYMEETYGDKAYTEGYNVYTTVDSNRQQAANAALQSGILAYDRSHGLRSKKPVMLATDKISDSDADPIKLPWTPSDSTVNWGSTLKSWQKTLQKTARDGILTPAAVTHIEKDGAWAINPNAEFLYIPFKNMEWAAPYINVNAVGKKPKQPTDLLGIGQQIWVEQKGNEFLLSQKPEVEGALVSMDPNNGAIQAMVGGFSQASNQFNRVNQADRQPGSAFKPFIYSAALSNGFTPASIINDAPIVIDDRSLESTWRPENYNGKFYGPTRLRRALYRSQNLVSIRILKAMGASNAVKFASALGLPKDKLNSDLSLALGASGVTPEELATGYAALANGGYAVSPYIIDRIESKDGQILYQADPAVVCHDCIEISEEESSDIAYQEDTPKLAERVMDERVNFLINSMLKDVIRRGTGKKAMQLGRYDLAGKTGTTNDQKDAWFSGYNRDLVTTVWVGFDQPRTLGRWAFGGSTALPIWIDYMRVALDGVAEKQFEQPDGIVTARIDPETGLLAAPGQTDAIFEYFREENVPKETAVPAAIAEESSGPGAAAPEQIF